MTRKLLIIAIAISIHHATSYSFTPPRTSSSHPTIHIPKDDACIFSQKMTNQICHSVKISDNLASLYNGGVNIVSHVSNYKRMSYWTMKKRYVTAFLFLLIIYFSFVIQPLFYNCQISTNFLFEPSKLSKNEYLPAPTLNFQEVL